MKKPNALIHESSPYLLQHAYNPVDWKAWNNDSLQQARLEDKPLLISIGYSSCHWCHVMEHECFEDQGVAEIMNSDFIAIKVDREERPDIDHIYMDALQIMTGAGGWPLNIVALPNGKPFWGATYLPKDQWKSALQQLAQLYKEEPRRVLEYAEDLTRSLHHINLPEPEITSIQVNQIAVWIARWKQKFDLEFGGNTGAPKFMMPVRLNFLMHWGEVTKDTGVQNHVKKTLRYMAYGGLYDHLAGGFARYSVDARWHVPHFEKMLYDNAQLLSVYAQAYACYGDPLYLEITTGILDFVCHWWKHEEEGFYAAFDADSRDVSGNLTEGAYYTWKENELRELLQADFDLFREAFNINAYGKWEHDLYVLIRKETITALSERLNLDADYIQLRLQHCREILLKSRARRPAPALDNKLIVSWNGLLLSGLADAYRYCNLDKALEAAISLGNRLGRENLNLPHILSSTPKHTIGFLEDYACVIQGFISLYQSTWEISWMHRARNLTEQVLTDFSNPENPLFHFDPNSGPSGIRRTLETSDNVIPASNSIMGKNLFLLGQFFERKEWIDRSRAMLHFMSGSIGRYSEQYSNWLQLALWLDRPYLTMVFCNPVANREAKALNQFYLPHSLIAASTTASDEPLFKDRFHAQNSKIYICTFGHCFAPVDQIETAKQTALENLHLDSTA